LTLYEQLPKSSDGALKVKLINPVIDENSGEALKITEANNIRWKLTVEAGKKIDITFQYSIEWPQGRTVVE